MNPLFWVTAAAAVLFVIALVIAVATDPRNRQWVRQRWYVPALILASLVLTTVVQAGR